MLKVGFYLRELNFRGIANSIYIYARNNQTILKNKSIIFYNSTALDNQPEAIKEFKRKFKTIKVSSLNELERINKNLKLDYIFDFLKPFNTIIARSGISVHVYSGLHLVTMAHLNSYPMLGLSWQIITTSL